MEINRDMWKATVNYFKNLSIGTAKESSKRFIALYSVLVLISYIVIRFTNSKNIEIVLVELIAFVLSLLGVATWESIKTRKPEKKENQDESEHI